MRGSFTNSLISLYKALTKACLCLCLLLLAQSALHAAPAFKSANSYSFGWASSYTQSYTVSSGTDQIMLVYAILTHGGSVSALTYNGTALTSIGSVSAGNSTTMYVYRLVNPPVTTANLVLTNGGSGNAHIVISLYTGVNQTTPIGNTATGLNSGGTDPMAVSVSHTRSSASSTVLVASAMGQNGSPSSNGTNFGTGRHFANTGGETRSYALSDYSPGSTGTTSYTHTRVGGGWSTGGAYALELMPAAASGTPTFTPTATRTATRTRTPTPTITITRTATLTRTPTPTPQMQLTKTSPQSSVTIGDTLTFCISYTNDSAGTVTVNIWDTLSTYLTYVGCNNACTNSGGVVSWSIASVASGASGQVCVWGTVNGYPWLPGYPDSPLLFARLEDVEPVPALRSGEGQP